MGPFVVSGLPLDSIALSTWEALLREGKAVDVEFQCLGLVQALTLTKPSGPGQVSHSPELVPVAVIKQSLAPCQESGCL